MTDIRLYSESDLDEINERARIARDQPVPEKEHSSVSDHVPDPVAGDQMELFGA